MSGKKIVQAPYNHLSVSQVTAPTNNRGTLSAMKRFFALMVAAAIAVTFSYGAVQVANILTYPQTEPDTILKAESVVTDFFNDLTLPIKVARLQLQEADAEILMPVYGLETWQVSDSWGEARPGGRKHEGTDFFARTGTPIFSSTEGYVTRMRTTPIGGKNVMIMGPGGVRYYYAHLDRFPDGLQVGDQVTTDTVIGFVGNTGNAINTPPHLHMGVYVGREAVNPYPMLIDR